jgi:hypothetical protein
MPILLRQNEGIELVSVTAHGAAGTWVGQIGVEFAEVPLATFMT